jgi:uncharacterized protein with PQ loop repeat
MSIMIAAVYMLVIVSFLYLFYGLIASLLNIDIEYVGCTPPITIFSSNFNYYMLYAVLYSKWSCII